VSKEAVFVSHHFAAGDLAALTALLINIIHWRRGRQFKQDSKTPSVCMFSIGSSARINPTPTHCRPT